MSRPSRHKRLHWPQERIDNLLNKYAYVQNDRRTKAYMGWVSPQDFLNATTPPAERPSLESEAKPLDLNKLHGELQEMFVEGRIDYENEFFQIAGHEGRHRMMALRNAGYTQVPVAFYVYSGHEAEPVSTLFVPPQRYGHAVSEGGFWTGKLTPISWEYASTLRNDFTEPAASASQAAKSTPQPTAPWERRDMAANGRPVMDNFKDWFSKSIVQAQGRPLVVFHGTSSDFDEFRLAKGGELGPGIYFSSSVNEATGYMGTNARGANAGLNIIPVFLRLENPFVVRRDANEYWDRFGGASDDEVILNAKAAGHDGVVFERAVQRWVDGQGAVDTGERQTHYIVFEPSQVKSALGNSGLYLREGGSLTDAEAELALRAARRARDEVKEHARFEVRL